MNTILKKFKILNACKYSISVKRLITNEKTISKGETVTLNNQTVYFEKIGTGKHHLFLIPGALGSTRLDFSKQLEKLNRDKFTVVAWDPPGYGQSRPPDRQFPLDFFHQDAKAAAMLLKHLGISKTNVIGWSSGGVVALILAAQNPELVEKLVVFGAEAMISEKDIQIYENLRDVNNWSEKIKKPMVDIYGEEYLKKTWNGWVDTFIINPSLDPMINRIHPILIKENILISEFTEWEDAGHNLHIQFADRFNETVENFILN